MNKPQHTPGPWSYVENVGFYSNGTPFADPYFGNGEADIRLVCAAPDLLEALKYARRFVNASEVDIAFIDAAIQKATQP